MLPKFNCTECGVCCRRVGNYPDFPEPIREDGSCIHLGDDNKCMIYEERPLICRVNGFWERFLTEKMSIEDWHLINYSSCQNMITEEGLDKSWIPKPDNTN